MLLSVPVPDGRALDDYREPAGDEAVDRLLEAAEPLKGARLIHVSSTSFGGGVAEVLNTQVALLRELGIDADWQLIEGSEEFFTVTKLAHNALQGAGVPWSESLERTYLDRVAAQAPRFDEHPDFTIVHDPQPVALLTFLEEAGERPGRWVWRCHIDLSAPMESVWAFFAGHVSAYDGSIFSIDEYVRAGLTPRIGVIPPSIDPISPKNAALAPEAIEEILTAYSISGASPIVTQVSRFDPWKDPLGVIDAYRIVKESIPDLQLVLVGSMAHDDPEAWHYLDRTEEHRAGDPDIHILTDLQDAGALAVNAFQRASTVVVQKSIAEGFGLTASEAMWKGKPVVAGAVGGLRIQVLDGETGFLVNDVETCAARVAELVRDPDLQARMGTAGYERVRERFLSTREVEETLRFLGTL